MVGRQLRGREAIALDLVGVTGITAFLLGLVWLQDSKNLGFDVGAAVSGVVGQLSTTLPAALLVTGAAVLDLAAALVLTRLARTRPFDSIAEALIAAMVVAVIKDTLLLGALGGFGLFRAPILLAIDVVLVLAVWLPSIGPRLRPLFDAPGGLRSALSYEAMGSIPMAALVAIVWAGPVLLQLASPVVPFIDVLPNYVGPVEHLRTFGWFSPLSATQSPIIGPSRTVLGYDALLGSMATMTNLSGALAIDAFILPQTVLVAAGVHRLATSLRSGDPAVGPWALLAFALTQSFARLSDARGTVVVVPLVCLAVALAAQQLMPPQRSRSTAAGGVDGSDSRGDERGGAWHGGPGFMLGLALAAAILVHPVIGFFAAATVGIVALLRPRELAPDVAVAALTSGVIALPQLGTMIGLSLPTVSLAVSIVVAISFGLWAARLVQQRAAVRDWIVRVAEMGRWLLAAGVVLALLGAVGLARLDLSKLPKALGDGIDLILGAAGILLVTLAAGIALGSRGARSLLVLAGLAVGVAALLLVSILPDDLGLLGDALRFEVPKTVYYWLGSIAAAGAAPALAYIWAAAPAAWVVRVGLVAVFVAASGLPLRAKPIDAYHLGEHRFAETFAIDLHFAGSGFWLGFPDSRTLVDPPRQAILDAVRDEIDGGRLGHDTPVLHIASSFQEWVATPLGVFDGVTETFVSLDPEHSHQTVGGRLYGFDSLHGFLATQHFAYVVLEPRDLPGDLREQIMAAGYRSIFGNAQGEVFAAG